MTESAEPADPMEPIEKKEPMEAIEQADPIEPIERTDLLEPIERNESSDHNDHRDAPLLRAIRPSCPERCRGSQRKSRVGCV